MTSSDEKALLARARAGERDALAEIYDRYSPAIYRYVARRVGSGALAEDLTGQVFLRMLESLDRGGGWKTSFRAWLYRIAANLVVDHYRRQGSRKTTELHDWLESDAAGPAYRVERQLRIERIRRAMRELTQEQCQVIVLRFGEGLTNREVAEIMGKSEGAIKALQHRAVNALRRLVLEPESV